MQRRTQAAVYGASLKSPTDRCWGAFVGQEDAAFRPAICGQSTLARRVPYGDGGVNIRKPSYDSIRTTYFGISHPAA
jgi:hypothetical protein